MSETHESQDLDSSSQPKYTVVARRYRPKTFEELVGQDTVAQALVRAIETNRVGHAYLFTGARGVGKTSTARIFAKALNASQDGSGRFDPTSEIALAIDNGEDMDVIEIDGASNRGIDEIRQLRANASIRPTQSRFKIYIIDEVHMLTTQAFNALLKTLEEPPGHVNFIFCTTDPEKIPITVLSRCQRFDFPPVQADQILERLKFICSNEGTEADEDALRLIARRAAGSLRDSQSLLEQLLSFGSHRITVDDVHAMLGTADETRLASFAQCMIQRNAAGALHELDAAMGEGVDPGQLAEQLLGYLRDMMALAIGGSTDLMRTANPTGAEALRASGKSWGTMTLLSAMQLLDEALVRMKHSVQPRILLEVALVQICNLQDLQLLSDVVKGLASGHRPVVTAAPVPAAHAPSPAAPSPQTASPRTASPQVPSSDSSETSSISTAGVPKEEPESDSKKKEPEIVSGESALEYFRRAVGPIDGVVQQAGWMTLGVQPLSNVRWRVLLARDAKFAIDWFRKPENDELVRNALRPIVGNDLELEWVLTDREVPPGMKPADEASDTPSTPRPIPQGNSNQRSREAMSYPLVQKFMTVFEGHVFRVDDPPSAMVPPPKAAIADDPVRDLETDA
ncbi:MAG: DNA polymerase III subunit gamma/tau [Planctomycetota bacterium]